MLSGSFFVAVGLRAGAVVTLLLAPEATGDAWRGAPAAWPRWARGVQGLRAALLSGAGAGALLVGALLIGAPGTPARWALGVLLFGVTLGLTRLEPVLDRAIAQGLDQGLDQGLVQAAARAVASLQTADLPLCAISCAVSCPSDAVGSAPFLVPAEVL